MSWWSWLRRNPQREREERRALQALDKEIEVETAEQESAEVLAEVIKIHPLIPSDEAEATERVARDHAERRRRLERQRDLLVRRREGRSW